MAGDYKNLNMEERKILENMYKKGESFMTIAQRLDRDLSTIYREIKGCDDIGYSAVRAQAIANQNKQRIALNSRKRGSATRMKIKECIRQQPEASKKQIATCSGMSYATVQRYYATLVKELENEEEIGRCT